MSNRSTYWIFFEPVEMMDEDFTAMQSKPATEIEFNFDGTQTSENWMGILSAVVKLSDCGKGTEYAAVCISPE